MRTCMVWLAMILMAGLACPSVVWAWKDVGAVDYFRVSDGQGVSRDEKSSPPSGWENLNGKDRKPQKRELNYLVRKYAQTGQPAILSGQCFSISLSTAFIGKFIEIGKKGEIAIVARVSERKAGSLDFSSDAADSGRLIYFSNDVREKQTLNFSYLPIYGPISYNGRALDIQLYVIEIDNVEQFKPLLSTVAKLGQKVYPPASEALGMLDKIGGALLSSAKDDQMFEYSFCLLPQAAETVEGGEAFQHGAFPALECGPYVLLRCQDRAADQEALFSDLLLDKHDFRLKRISEDDASIVPYTDDSYLVVHVKRESYALSVDEENSIHAMFSDFRKRENELSASYMARVTADLDALKEQMAHQETLKELYSLYENVAAAKAGQESLARLDAASLLSGVQEQIARREACATGNVCPEIPTRRELSELLLLMRNSVAFSGVKDKLTYDVLRTADAGRDDAILESVGEKVKTIQ